MWHGNLINRLIIAPADAIAVKAVAEATAVAMVAAANRDIGRRRETGQYYGHMFIEVWAD